jgi:hypothetical protein
LYFIIHRRGIALDTTAGVNRAGVVAAAIIYHSNAAAVAATHTMFNDEIRKRVINHWYLLAKNIIL